MILHTMTTSYLFRLHRRAALYVRLASLADGMNILFSIRLAPLAHRNSSSSIRLAPLAYRNSFSAIRLIPLADGNSLSAIRLTPLADVNNLSTIRLTPLADRNSLSAIRQAPLAVGNSFSAIRLAPVSRSVRVCGVELVDGVVSGGGRVVVVQTRGTLRARREEVTELHFQDLSRLWGVK